MISYYQLLSGRPYMTANHLDNYQYSSLKLRVKTWRVASEELQWEGIASSNTQRYIAFNDEVLTSAITFV